MALKPDKSPSSSAFGVSLAQQRPRMAQAYLPLMSGRSGEKAEWRVMTALQGAFSARGDAEIHAQFPVRGEFLRVPDVLLVDRELGFVVIEVKGIYATQIESVAGDCWRVRGYFDQTEIRPYQQAQSALTLLTQAAGQRVPRHRVAVALPYVSIREWQDRGFRLSPEILLREHLAEGLVERLRAIPPAATASWDDDQWRLWREWLGGSRVEETSPPEHKGSIIRRLDGYVAGRDRQLRGDALEMPSGIFRLRGIAGSGKTTLLVQSAAWMLFNQPGAQIGYVYHSRSLFDLCFSLVCESLEKLASSRGARVVSDVKTGTIALDGCSGAIRIFNAWGSMESPGFYRLMSAKLARNPRSLNSAKAEYRRRFGRESTGGDLLPFICRELLEHGADRIEPCFDALFIDEAQDLISADPSVSWEGREPFFWLAYCALRPADVARPEQRRLVFAYDEAQSLNTLRIPTARQLFGDELSALFVGRSRVMRCSFRNPKPILLAAHALGVGLLRRGGAVQGLNAEEWKAIGYEIDGKLHPGQVATLLRTDENSPNPVPRWSREESIAMMTHPNEHAELEALRAALLQDIREHELRPSRDILVIDLHGAARSTRVRKVLETTDALGAGVPCFHPALDSADRNEFWRSGAVTVSDIRRAKGNEAPMVYVIGLEALTSHKKGWDEVIRARNSLFVALTRAQAWISLSGVNRDAAAQTLFEEIRRVVGAVQSTSSAIQFEWRRDRGYRDLTHETQAELPLLVA